MPTIQLPEVFRCDVSASGFAILADLLSDQNNKLVLNMEAMVDKKLLDKESEIRISSASIVQQVIPQLNPDFVVNGISPEMLVLNFKPRASKKVPVVHHLRIA